MVSRAGRLVPALIGSLLVAAPLAAQQAWLGSGRAGEVSLEILRPDLKGLGDQSFMSMAMFLSGRFPLGRRMFLVTEIPIATGSLSTSYFGFSTRESGSTVGDPYVGIEEGDGTAFGELGVRVPLASENQAAPELIGMAADLERTEAFAPKVATVSLFLNYRAAAPSGLTFRIRGGPLAWIATQTGVLGAHDAELWAAYAVQAGYAAPRFTLLGGIGGRAIITEDVTHRFTDQVVLSATFGSPSLRPGVSLRVPIDNDRDQLVGYSIGISLSVALR